MACNRGRVIRSCSQWISRNVFTSQTTENGLAMEILWDMVLYIISRRRYANSRESNGLMQNQPVEYMVLVLPLFGGNGGYTKSTSELHSSCVPALLKTTPSPKYPASFH